jgi:hypothetical protein
MQSTLTKHQKKIYGPKIYTEDGTTYRIKAEIRYDDDCGNGHNSFSITADIDRLAKNGRWMEDAGGCLHEAIARHFPELAPLIKWHLMSSDGPLHYFANTLYFAGDRDCWGKRKGEVRSYEKKIAFDGFPVRFKFSKAFIAWVDDHRAEAAAGFTIKEVEHKEVRSYEKKIAFDGFPVRFKFSKAFKDTYPYGSKYTFHGFNCAWHACPFDTAQEAEEFRAAFHSIAFSIVATPDSWGEGKAPELEAARSAAIWPEATLAQLQDRAALEARLPGLIAEFRADVEKLGFVF